MLTQAERFLLKYVGRFGDNEHAPQAQSILDQHDATAAEDSVSAITEGVSGMDPREVLDNIAGEVANRLTGDYSIEGPDFKAKVRAMVVEVLDERAVSHDTLVANELGRPIPDGGHIMAPLNVGAIGASASTEPIDAKTLKG